MLFAVAGVCAAVEGEGQAGALEDWNLGSGRFPAAERGLAKLPKRIAPE